MSIKPEGPVLSPWETALAEDASALYVLAAPSLSLHLPLSLFHSVLLVLLKLRSRDSGMKTDQRRPEDEAPGVRG